MSDFPFIDFNDPPKSVELLFFPGGEPHAKVAEYPDDDIFIKANIRTWDDFGKLIVLLDALDRQGKGITLWMPYFPGARQDRTDGTAPLTCALYAQILCTLVNRLIVFDIHSEKAEWIIKNHIEEVVFIPSSYLPFEAMPEDVDFVIAPDAGAVERAKEVRNRFYPDAGVVHAEKQRNSRTGALANYKFTTGIEDLEGNFLVVDDICDGGWTFNLLAKAWKENRDLTKSSLKLFVTHGIFSKGVDNIDAIYEDIYTTDSFCCIIEERRPERLHIYELDKIMRHYIKSLEAQKKVAATS